MAKSKIVLALVLSISISGLTSMRVAAQAQIATVSSNSAFQLRGANVTPGTGVPNWPVMSGDTIQAGASAVTFTFPDGSSIVLAPQARVTVSLVDGKLVFLLAAGSAHYALSTLTAVNVECKEKKNAVNAVSGELHCGGNAIPVGWWAAGGAAAAGITAGVIASHGNGSQVSPTR